MNNFGITDNSFERILKTLSEFNEVETALIFGSRSKGNFKKGSDIDISIKGKKSSILLAMNISGRLNESEPIPYFIDIVDYNSINNIKLKKHLDRVGKVFYERKD